MKEKNQLLQMMPVVPSRVSNEREIENLDTENSLAIGPQPLQESYVEDSSTLTL